MKIVRQRDFKDCGICSLESIVKYYGGYVPLEIMRMDAKVSLEGTTALNLVYAGKKYGFDSVGVKLDTLEEIKQLPAIVHKNLKNGLTHYVVLYKVYKDKVILMDPAKGKVIQSKKDFYEEWSHIVLLFYPKRKITVLKKENTLMEIFFKILKSEKRLVGIIILISIFLTIFTIAGGYYFQIMASSISSNYDLVYLKIMVIIFFLLTIFKISLSYIRNYLENHLNKNIDCILNADFLNHLYNLPLNALTSRTSGEIVTRVSELTSVKNLVTELFVNSCLDFFLMIAVLPLLININGKLFFILFLSLLLYLLIGMLSSKTIYKKAYQNIEYESEFNNVLLEDVKMINSIKNLHVVDNRLKRVEKTLTKFLYDNYLFSIFLNKVGSLKNAIYEICLFMLNSYGFYLVLKNRIDIINLVTFNALVTFFFDPLKNLIDSLPKYNFLKATITKLNDFLNINKEEYGVYQSISSNDIEVKNLKYSYNNYDTILNNINFKIKSGEIVLLNGISGSGKSTICKILDKYIDEYEGDVLIGGINIKDLNVATIRKNILYVNQQESLFTGTIRDNITMGKSVDEVFFQRICYISGVDLIVKSKPLRYETGINASGNSLSGGEKQRIILARALLNNFEILILDEALSEVDYKLERIIIENIKNNFKGKTIIYITHKNHNKIFDRIIEIGRKHELS